MVITYPGDVKTLEAGSNYAREFPRLELNRYIGIMSAPLETADFKPDVTIIYCNSEQLSLFLLGDEYEKGHSLKCSLSSHAACVFSIVPSIQNGKCNVALPCRGDRYSAMAKDYEIIFIIPIGKLEYILAGLRYVEKNGSKLPRSYHMDTEGFLPQSYRKIAHMIGMLDYK